MPAHPTYRLPHHFELHSLPMDDEDAHGGPVAHSASAKCWCHPTQDAALWMHHALDGREAKERHGAPGGKGWHVVPSFTPRHLERNAMEAGEITVGYARKMSRAIKAAFLLNMESTTTTPPCSYLYDDGEACLHYLCPACGYSHLVPVTGDNAHTWNGRIDGPTIAPSLTWEIPSPDQPGEVLICHHQLLNGWVSIEPGSDFGTEGDKLPLAPLKPR